jgi:C1A family cysteine protease
MLLIVFCICALVVWYRRHCIVRHVVQLGGAPLPSYLKWKESYMCPIRNQGGCASCWAISIADMLADTVNLKTGGTFGIKPLSSQFLLSCYNGHLGCNVGDSPENVYDLPQLTEQGIPLESEFPYEASDTLACPRFKEGILRIKTVKHSSEDLCIDPSTVVFSSAQDVINRNIVKMKRALQRGPIVGTLRVHEDVYSWDGKSIYTVTPGSKLVGYHAILIIGYADANVNKHESGFQDTGYWVCRSSWGTRWGACDGNERGYLYIRMGVNEADVESRASRCDVVIPDEFKDAAAKADMSTMRYTSYDDYVNDPERINFLGSVKAAQK